MASVFIVTQGSYSDYSILAVFGDEHEAEEFASRQKSWAGDNAEVEEWELDRWKEAVEKDTWQATIDLKSGELTRTGFPVKQYVPQGCTCWERYHNKQLGTITLTSTVDFDHADKLAVEARQAYLREETILSIVEGVH